MISINDMGRKRLVARLKALRALLQREYEAFPLQPIPLPRTTWCL
jgi:hypothetical protein